MDLASTKTSSFYKETFTGLTLTGQSIKGKEFENCTFEKCIFIECTFNNCKFVENVFTGCTLSAIKPFNSRFMNVTFKNSKVIGFDWTKAESIRFLSFEDCDIRYSNFSYAKIPDMKLVRCSAQEVNFSGADLTGGVFTKTDFSKSIFSNTNLTDTDFRQAFNYGIDFHFNILKMARFSLPDAVSLLNGLDIILEN